jgi:hypothetical protein
MSAAYDPNKQGWGAAAITCLLTAGLAFTAWSIHNATYRHPRDPMAVQVYHERDAAKENSAAAEHGAAANHDAAGGDHAGDAAAPKTDSTTARH